MFPSIQLKILYETLLILASLVTRPHLAHARKVSQVLASFPGPTWLSVARSMEKQERPGIFSHVSDVRIERMVERVQLCMGTQSLGSPTLPYCK